MSKASQLIEDTVNNIRTPSDIFKELAYGYKNNESDILQEASDWKVYYIVDIKSGKAVEGPFTPVAKADKRLEKKYSYDTHQVISKAALAPQAYSHLKEEINGDVELPYTPEDPDQIHPQDYYEEPGMITFEVESPEQQVQFNEMVNALNSAQVEYDLQQLPEGDWQLSWPEGQESNIDNILTGLGIEFEEEDMSNEYFGHGAEDLADMAIEAVMEGADPYELVSNLFEKKKGQERAEVPGGEKDVFLPKKLKKMGKYDTPDKAARAIAAWIGRKNLGDKEMNKRALAGRLAKGATRRK